MARESLSYRILPEFVQDTTPYKYELTADYERALHYEFPGIVRKYFTIDEPDGPEPQRIKVRKGYRWDGPSGPTIDTPAGMAGSLVHDVLYQAGREGILDKRYRKAADNEFQAVLAAEGMGRFRRWYWWAAVRIFARRHFSKRWRQ